MTAIADIPGRAAESRPVRPTSPAAPRTHVIGPAIRLYGLACGHCHRPASHMRRIGGELVVFHEFALIRRCAAPLTIRPTRA